MSIEDEYNTYLELIRKELAEGFNWEMSVDEIDDFLIAKGRTDVKFGARN